LQTDADTAKKEFGSIQADLKTMFPDDKPSKDGGHLYSGRTGAGTGRKRAEDAKDAGNADPKNKAAGITHRTLQRCPADAKHEYFWAPALGLCPYCTLSTEDRHRPWWAGIAACPESCCRRPPS